LISVSKDAECDTTSRSTDSAKWANLYLSSFDGYLILRGGRGLDGTNGVKETAEKLGTRDFNMNLALMAL
jgi:hypothetical protein